MLIHLIFPDQLKIPKYDLFMDTTTSIKIRWTPKKDDYMCRLPPNFNIDNVKIFILKFLLIFKDQLHIFLLKLVDFVAKLVKACDC